MGKKHKNNQQSRKKQSKKIHDLEELKEELIEEIASKEKFGENVKEIELEPVVEKKKEKVTETKKEKKQKEKPNKEKNKEEKPNSKKGKRTKEPKKGFSFKKLIFRLLQIAFLIIIVFSGIEIIKWSNDNQKTQEMMENVSEAVKQEIVENEEGEPEVKYTVDFEALKEMNPDTVAWIKVNNTNVEYPIVKTEDNEYYLTHSFDKSYSKAGWIFADYRNNVDGTDRNLIVYGHNRMDGSMFASLEQCLEEEWYTNPENRAIIFMTENEEAIYEIFSIYEIKDEEYYIRTEHPDDEYYERFLDTLRKRSIYYFETALNFEDQILTLSTCTNYNNGRIVIHARKLRNEVEVVEPEPEEIEEEIE